MGVHHRHFLLYGYEIGYDQFRTFDPDPEEDAYENPLEKKYRPTDETKPSDFVVVSDGRGGDYCYMGIVQYMSKDSRDGRTDFTPHQEIQKPNPDDCLKLGRVLGEYDIETQPEPNHFVFTHYK